MTEQTTRSDSDLRAVADRHGIGPDAVRHMLQALAAGNGTMAQFDHPEFGGFGQWSSGGMVMVGRMNDHALKARVSALCAELAAALPSLGSAAAPQRWWPEGLGHPASVGAQNGTRYAWFPEGRRLAVETAGRLRLYDTGRHVITGVSQASGQAPRFSGPDGSVSLDALTPLDERPSPPPSAPAPQAAPTAAAAPATPPAANTSPGDALSILERLADLHARGILTDAEFQAKKTDLLARL